MFAQQDQSIGQRFEPGFDRSFQRLQRLGVVVGDQRDRMGRIGSGQGVGENLRHIEPVPLLGCLMKLQVQGYVEQHHFALDQVNILL
ncbi:hypothetical protein D3C76_1300700 [compost metagenome]